MCEHDEEGKEIMLRVVEELPPCQHLKLGMTLLAGAVAASGGFKNPDDRTEEEIDDVTYLVAELVWIIIQTQLASGSPGLAINLGLAVVRASQIANLLVLGTERGAMVNALHLPAGLGIGQSVTEEELNGWKQMVANHPHLSVDGPTDEALEAFMGDLTRDEKGAAEKLISPEAAEELRRLFLKDQPED